jgi:hypothetical protein
MTHRTDKSPKIRRKINYRRVELLIPPEIARALDDYRASKRPIPLESDTIRFLLVEALITEGFNPDE